MRPRAIPARSIAGASRSDRRSFFPRYESPGESRGFFIARRCDSVLKKAHLQSPHCSEQVEIVCGALRMHAEIVIAALAWRSAKKREKCREQADGDFYNRMPRVDEGAKSCDKPLRAGSFFWIRSSIRQRVSTRSWMLRCGLIAARNSHTLRRRSRRRRSGGIDRDEGSIRQRSSNENIYADIDAHVDTCRASVFVRTIDHRAYAHRPLGPMRSSIVFHDPY